MSARPLALLQAGLLRGFNLCSGPSLAAGSLGKLGRPMSRSRRSVSLGLGAALPFLTCSCHLHPKHSRPGRGRGTEAAGSLWGPLIVGPPPACAPLGGLPRSPLLSINSARVPGLCLDRGNSAPALQGCPLLVAAGSAIFSAAIYIFTLHFLCSSGSVPSTGTGTGTEVACSPLGVFP